MFSSCSQRLERIPLNGSATFGVQRPEGHWPCKAGVSICLNTCRAWTWKKTTNERIQTASSSYVLQNFISYLRYGCKVRGYEDSNYRRQHVWRIIHIQALIPILLLASLWCNEVSASQACNPLDSCLDRLLFMQRPRTPPFPLSFIPLSPGPIKPRVCHSGLGGCHSRSDRRASGHYNHYLFICLPKLSLGGKREWG